MIVFRYSEADPDIKERIDMAVCDLRRHPFPSSEYIPVELDFQSKYLIEYGMIWHDIFYN